MNSIASIAARIRLVLSLTAVIAIGILAAPSALYADEAPMFEGEYSGASVKLCLNCHGDGSDKPAHGILMTPHAMVADPKAPFGENGNNCESCHGPAKAHLKRQADGTRELPPMTFGANVPADQKNAVCRSCHAGSEHQFMWQGSTHDVEGVACIDCHDVHSPTDKVRQLETQTEVCFGCHKEQRAMFLRQSRHPVQADSATISHTGLMACTDCHQPHGSAGPANLNRNTVNETCYDCHAEKRGPFLWEHQPVREDCSTCHTPHGSNYPNLLQARGPWLCQRCHMAGFHPSGAYGGSGTAVQGGADQRILGKDCLNCHSQVHGSNHPSGIRLTR